MRTRTRMGTRGRSVAASGILRGMSAGVSREKYPNSSSGSGSGGVGQAQGEGEGRARDRCVAWRWREGETVLTEMEEQQARAAYCDNRMLFAESPKQMVLSFDEAAREGV